MDYSSPLGGLWGLVTVLGPIVFLGVLAWVVTSNRRASPRNREIAEESAVALRDQLTKEREEREGKSDAP